jgi:penicillin-binding protein 2
MATRVALKDHLRESQLFSNRAVIALVAVVLMIVVIIARMVYLQVVGHEHFATLSHNNRVNIVPLPPTRGLIYDRRGVLLAQNLPAFSLELVPEQIHQLDEVIEELGEVIEIEEDDIARFHKLRKQKPTFESIPLRFHLTDDEVARFAINRHRFPGVDIAARLVRNYPLDKHLVHAVGYVGRINEEELQRLDPSDYRGTSYVGKIGIEKAYEDILHGKVGVQHLEVNATGRTLRVLQHTPPVPGKNLILTLDTRLQIVAEQALGDERGAIVAIEPRTGDVLAMVSTPSYDPNLFVLGIDQKSYTGLQQSADRPLFNRAVRGQYPPGSTIKPFVGLAGLEYEQISMENKVFCPGWYSLRGDSHRYRDWKRGGHGHTDLRAAIAESCDVFFYDLALNLGIDRINTFLGMFGFGQATGIDVTGELPALLPSREWKRRIHRQPWFPGETLITGIGQGFTLATPLQLASATAALANRGILMQPRTVKAIQDPNTEEAIPLEPVKLKTIHFANPDNWDYMMAAMTEVVHGRKGTARKIGEDSQYIIAGKTGTAQVFTIKQDEKYEADEIDKRLRDHALFIALAPVDNPQIAVAVIVENGGSGSGVAAPIARQVLDQYLLDNQDRANAG